MILLIVKRCKMAKPDQTKMAYYKKIAQLESKIKSNVAEIYACFCKVLYEDGWNADEIEELFIRTQEAWNENVGQMESMIEWCEEVTGIEIQGK